MNCARVLKNSAISDLYFPQTDGELSESILKSWTLQAIECYELGQNCSKCSITKGNYSFICQMPKVVKVLLKERGKPDLSTNDKSDFYD